MASAITALFGSPQPEPQYTPIGVYGSTQNGATGDTVALSETAQATLLQQQGLTTSEIADQLGITTSAVLSDLGVAAVATTEKNVALGAAGGA
jgi:hypothetical protein